MTWDEFRDALVQFYKDQKIAGKYTEIENVQVEIAPAFVGTVVSGAGTFRGIEEKTKDNGRALKLDVLEPLTAR